MRKRGEKSMDINAGNILIILIGIALCFFGIYFKRAAQIMIGFAWGALFAWLVILVLSVQAVSHHTGSVIEPGDYFKYFWVTSGR